MGALDAVGWVGPVGLAACFGKQEWPCPLRRVQGVAPFVKVRKGFGLGSGLGLGKLRVIFRAQGKEK
jgi:hypothetical protein